jgi:hypothetical protein
MYKAPWTEDEVKSLNDYQVSGVMHPFTCGTKDCGGLLLARQDGWHCPDCDYTQDWAHEWMTDGSWRQFECSIVLFTGD